MRVMKRAEGLPLPKAINFDPLLDQSVFSVRVDPASCGKLMVHFGMPGTAVEDTTIEISTGPDINYRDERPWPLNLLPTGRKSFPRGNVSTGEGIISVFTHPNLDILRHATNKLRNLGIPLHPNSMWDDYRTREFRRQVSGILDPAQTYDFYEELTGNDLETAQAFLIKAVNGNLTGRLAYLTVVAAYPSSRESRKKADQAECEAKFSPDFAGVFMITRVRDDGKKID